MKGTIMWFFNKSPQDNKQQLLSPFLPCISHLPPSLDRLHQYEPIWFEFESSNRVDLNSHMIIEDPTGLFQFLRFRGREIIARNIKINCKRTSRYQQVIVFYEKDYHWWRR